MPTVYDINGGVVTVSATAVNANIASEKSWVEIKAGPPCRLGHRQG
jgi:hypothetical protein